jgi:hypothetical protein
VVKRYSVTGWGLRISGENNSDMASCARAGVMVNKTVPMHSVPNALVVMKRFLISGEP